MLSISNLRTCSRNVFSRRGDTFIDDSSQSLPYSGTKTYSQGERNRQHQYRNPTEEAACGANAKIVEEGWQRISL